MDCQIFDSGSLNDNRQKGETKWDLYTVGDRIVIKLASRDAHCAHSLGRGSMFPMLIDAAFSGYV